MADEAAAVAEVSEILVGILEEDWEGNHECEKAGDLFGFYNPTHS